MLVDVSPFEHSLRAPPTVGLLPGSPEPAIRQRRIGTLELTACAAFVTYVVAGLWLRYSMHYAIADALVRSASARAVLSSRDAHLAALGFGWMPLPTFIQLPFSLVLERFGRAELAGPVSTAACMALTVLVVGRLCRRLGAGRGMTAALVLGFAANPVIIFYAANGMSEASAFLFLAVAMSGYLGWVHEGRVTYLSMLSLGLAGAVLVRYEALLLVPLLAGLAAWEGKGVRQWSHTVLVVAVPSGFATAFWLAANWLIMGSPFAFLTALTSGEGARSDNPWLPPVDQHPFTAVTYAARWVLAFAPGLILCLPALLAPTRTRSRAGLGVLVAAGAFPAFIVLLLLRHATFGNPRYFVMTILFTVIGVAWLSRRHSSAHWPSRAYRAALATSVIVGAISGTVALRDPVRTSTEGEGRVFATLLGEKQPTRDFPNRPWRAATKILDANLAGGGRVLVDVRFAFPAELLSRHPKAFIIASDRDYPSILAAPAGQVDYLVVTPVKSRSNIADDARGILDTSPPGTWYLVGDLDVAQIYRAHWETVGPDSGADMSGQRPEPPTRGAP